MKRPRPAPGRLTFEVAGQVVGYTLVATNVGNVTLHDVSIADPMFESLECLPAQPTSLVPGASLTCTGSHTTTQAELNAGQVNNTGAVSGTGPAGQVVTATAGKSVMAVQSPHLTLAKSANVTNYGTLGQIVEYTLVAINDGNVTLHGVSIDDPMFAELECLPEQPATLAPGASLACTGSYAITQNDLDAGSLANTASASGLDPLNQAVDSQAATATVTASQSPQLALTKTAGAASYDHVGQVIAYSLLATNAGNVTLHDVAIADAKLGSLNCIPAQPAILAPGATLACDGSYTVTQADLDAGTVDNAAAASAAGPVGQVVAANASKSVPAAQQLSLSMAKSASLTSYSAVGQEIVYTLTATNDGNVTLDGVSIVDLLFVALDCTPAQPAVLAPDETLTCTATYTIAQADLDAGSIANTARAVGSGPQDQGVESSQAGVTVTAVQRPQLSLAKTAGPTAYDHVGQVINYTLVAQNEGNVTLSGASISDPQLGVLDCLTEQPALLAPGESLTCTGSHAITQADLDAGRFTNTAAAAGATPLGQSVAATASATVIGQGEPHLVLSKSADTPAFDHVGQVVAYTLVATNDGDLTLYGVGISDPTTDLEGCGPATLGPGQTLTCTGSHAVTQADLDAGRIDNTATASGSGPQQQPVSASASVSVPGVQAPALMLSKSADKASFDEAGVTIAYTLEATNAGNVTLHGVEIEDTLLGGMDCTPAQPAELAPGESLACSGSYVTSQGNLNAGKVENTANASGAGPAGQPVSATASR